MATFLDIGILRNFSVIFTWLLMYVAIYGFLEVINPFGKDKKNFHALVALAISFLGILSKSARYFVEFITPWFLVLILVLFFIIFIVRMFGLGEGDMVKVIKDSITYTWLLVIIVLIVFIAIGSTFGQRTLEATTGTPPSQPAPPIGPEAGQTLQAVQPGTGSTATPNNYAQNVVASFFHPKVLGMLFILLLGTFTIYFLSRQVTS